MEKFKTKMYKTINYNIVVANTKDGKIVMIDDLGQIFCEIDLKTFSNIYQWEEFKPPVFWFM